MIRNKRLFSWGVVFAGVREVGKEGSRRGGGGRVAPHAEAAEVEIVVEVGGHEAEALLDPVHQHLLHNAPSSLPAP
eukprot:2153001-Rhodomonas_salina.1